jgi:hypothetical protein
MKLGKKSKLISLVLSANLFAASALAKDPLYFVDINQRYKTEEYLQRNYALLYKFDEQIVRRAIQQRSAFDGLDRDQALEVLADRIFQKQKDSNNGWDVSLNRLLGTVATVRPHCDSW